MYKAIILTLMMLSGVGTIPCILIMIYMTMNETNQDA